NNPGGLDTFRERIASEIEQDRRKRNEYRGFIKAHNFQLKSVSVDHHEAHAYSAYSFSPFEKALVVTSDGRGDFMSVTVSSFTPDSMEMLYQGTSTDS